MAKKRSEKKSETLEVRLPHSKKEAFMAACEREGITASYAMRTFIDAYLKRSGRVKLKQITQEITMKLFQNPLKTAGAIGGAVAAATIFAASPSVAEDRDAELIAHPTTISYPIELAKQGVEAECEASFGVTIEGKPDNINVTCTHPGFVDEAYAATSTLQFSPKIENGQPVYRENVSYPYIFQLNDDDTAAEE